MAIIGHTRPIYHGIPVPKIDINETPMLIQ
jgi:hypothetical protein